MKEVFSLKVAFWSNARGKSCVTSNLACISVLSALRNPEERTIVFENHQNVINLGSTFFNQNPVNVVKEPSRYTVDMGLGKILTMIERGEDFLTGNLYSFMEDYLGKRLFYIPMETARNPDYMEYQLDRMCIRVLNYLEHYGDMVLVDTSSAPLSSSRKILQQSDMVVVNLNQNSQTLAHFFRNYSSVKEKAFYLIGNYDENSELTKGAITREYGIPGNKIATIPHNIKFSDAVSAGRLIPFLLKNYRCERWDENYGFIAAAREAEELFRNQLQIFSEIGVGK